jgi:hypothetical protein
MQRKYLIRLFQLTAIALTIVVSSCQKEAIEPRPTDEETNGTLIFIRAVEKDSTVTNSEQILLR